MICMHIKNTNIINRNASLRRYCPNQVMRVEKNSQQKAPLAKDIKLLNSFYTCSSVHVKYFLNFYHKNLISC